MKWFCIICLLLSGLRPAWCANEQASRPAAVIDKAVARGIDYLISQQQTNGAIVTAPPPNQPNANALTGLSIMALTAVGHRPTDDSPAGHALCKALDFILDPKRQDTVRTPGYFGGDDNSRMYGHGIVTLMLAEMVGMGVDARQDEVIRDRCQKAVDLIVRAQKMKKADTYKGGWRYGPTDVDADLSVTVWQVMALRAAKNAGLAVPKTTIDDAIAYIRTTDAPDKKMLAELPVNELKKLGCTVADTGDVVVIKPTDSEIEKAVAALLKDAVEGEVAA